MAKIRDIQPSADYGRVIVDQALEGLEDRITAIYDEASRSMRGDLFDFLDNLEYKDDMMSLKVEMGEITEEELAEWRRRRIYDTNRMRAKIEDLTQTMVHADEVAMAMVRKELPEVYATSYNFGGFRGEEYADAAGIDYTQFTIYNADAVRILATEDPDLLPANPRVDIPKDERWNRQHIQNEVLQGVLKGESVPQIADRMQNVATMDRNAALRNARTAVNGIENKGRKDATERLLEAGVPMVEVWSCTHDGRTRQSHILLDYTTPDEEGYFANGCQYPADPDGPEEEVYNCRCSLLTFIEGIDHSKDDELYAKMMEEEYFEDWVKVKEQTQIKEAAFQQNRARAISSPKAAREKKGEKTEPKKQEAPKLADIKEATTRKEAVELLESMGIHVQPSLARGDGKHPMDDETFIAQANQIAMLQATFDALPTKVGGTMIDYGRMDAIAKCTSSITGQSIGIKFSQHYYARGAGYVRSTIAGTQSRHWHVKTTDDFFIVASATHEYGHAFQDMVAYRQQMERLKAEGVDFTEAINTVRREAPTIKKEMMEEIIAIVKRDDPDFELTAETFSAYGMTKPEEFFAEAFCSAMGGEPNKVGLAMIEWLRGKGYGI